MPQPKIRSVTFKPHLEALAPAFAVTFELHDAEVRQPGQNDIAAIALRARVNLAEKNLYWGAVEVPFHEGLQLGQPVQLTGIFTYQVDGDLVIHRLLKEREENDLRVSVQCSMWYAWGQNRENVTKIGIAQETVQGVIPGSDWRKVVAAFYRDLKWVAIGSKTFEKLRALEDQLRFHTIDEVLALLTQTYEKARAQP